MSTPKSQNRAKRTYFERSSTVVNNGSPSLQLRQQIVLATSVSNVTPKKPSTRAAITNSPQIHVSAKDIKKSVKAICPAANIERLERRSLATDGPNQSILVDCAPNVTPTKSIGDFLFQMKNKQTPLAIKQIDNNFKS